MGNPQISPNYPGRVLLIDDDADTRNIYQEVLSGAGYKVEFAGDGESGLAKILQGGYDLILLDIMLPKIDGIGILRKIKETAETTSRYNGPIIVLSALNHQAVIDEALKLGARAYILKSDLNPGQIVSRISEILQQKEAASSN